MKTVVKDIADAWKYMTFLTRLFFVLFTTATLSHFVLWLCVQANVVQVKWLTLPLLLTLVALAGGGVLLYLENKKEIALIALLVILAFFVRVGLLVAS